METKEKIEDQKVDQTIQLVKGDFTPLEASHVIIGLIDLKINFHKVQRLQNWEGNHHCETEQLDNRIEELEKEKQIAIDYIKNLRGSGKKLKIDGVLDIRLS